MKKKKFKKYINTKIVFEDKQKLLFFYYYLSKFVDKFSDELELKHITKSNIIVVSENKLEHCHLDDCLRSCIDIRCSKYRIINNGDNLIRQLKFKKILK